MVLYFFAAILLLGCGNNSEPIKIHADEHSLFENKTLARKKNIKLHYIAIAPYHEVDSCTADLIACEFEAFYFNVKTFILPRAIMPDSLLAYSKTRYNANKILRHLELIKPEQANYILAITDERIAACGDSTQEMGVAGLGDRPGYCSVVSTASLKRKLPDTTQYTQRLIKACMHEMGHNFGLPHCKSKNKKCFMRDAGGTILTLDEEDRYLCNDCIEKLKKRGIKLRNHS